MISERTITEERRPDGVRVVARQRREDGHWISLGFAWPDPDGMTRERLTEALHRSMDDALDLDAATVASLGLFGNQP